MVNVLRMIYMIISMISVHVAGQFFNFWASYEGNKCHDLDWTMNYLSTIKHQRYCRLYSLRQLQLPDNLINAVVIVPQE